MTKEQTMEFCKELEVLIKKYEISRDCDAPAFIITRYILSSLNSLRIFQGLSGRMSEIMAKQLTDLINPEKP